MEMKSPKEPNRLSEKVNDPVSRPAGSIAGMARHYGPRSWIPQNGGLSVTRCPIAQVIGVRRRGVTVFLASVRQFWVHRPKK